MKIRVDDLRGPEIRALLEEHLRNMRAISPPESVHALDLEALRRPGITFWTVWSGIELLGCGALKQLDAAHGEIKSMRTASAHRRKGVARAMLQRIVQEAQARGLRRLSLETGSQPAFLPARTLYESFGFSYCGPFERYVEDPNSVFMTRTFGDADSAELQAYYAARASEYDRVYARPDRQQDLRAMEQWLPTVVRGESVLEVACGTGYWTAFLAPVANSVVGVDAASETLAIARARVAAPHVRFVVGDAYRLPVAPSSFDAGFAGFWISHVPRARVREFLRELGRALVPGATVVLLDNRFVAGSSTPIREQDAHGNTYQQRELEDGSTHRVLKNFPSQADLRQALEGIGAEARFHEWQYYWALEYRNAAG